MANGKAKIRCNNCGQVNVTERKYAINEKEQMKNKQRFTITVSEKGKRKKYKFTCNEWMLILSDPNFSKGIAWKTSTNSIPRMLGWMEFLKMMFQDDILFLGRQKRGEKP